MVREKGEPFVGSRGIDVNALANRLTASLILTIGGFFTMMVGFFGYFWESVITAYTSVVKSLAFSPIDGGVEMMNRAWLAVADSIPEDDPFAFAISVFIIMATFVLLINGLRLIARWV